MRRRSWTALLAGAAAALALGVGAFAYDSSRQDEIADGITIAGVDVGGMDEDEAAVAVRRRLLAPLRRPLEVRFGSRTWTLPGTRLKLRAEVGEAVRRALAESRAGGLPGRLVRYVSGGEVQARIAAPVAYSRTAINRFVRRVAADLHRGPVNAGVAPSADSLAVVAGHDGRKLRDDLLARELRQAVLDADGDAVIARVRPLAPEVTKGEVAAEYPSYLTLDRASFTLRLWRHLKLARTYTVAVGQEGLETPEGLYSIQAKEENPVWHVPESAWAGDLAGQTIPPGPSNPIKGRWMAIFEGAGIHGTEDVGSLGSAASHGCVRMSVPDVIDLYPEVEVGTPIYIG